MREERGWAVHESTDGVAGSSEAAVPLMEHVRRTIRIKHYSRDTERAYSGWIRRYILFHSKRHPRSMGATEVERFLSYLATIEKVSSATQNQALSAILFLYRDVLHADLGP